MRGKPTLAIDFDGVIHDYTKGWKDGSIYGELTPGFREWLEEARKEFDVIVFSSRDVHQIRTWLHDRDIEVEVTSTKPKAFLSIDDRALTFTGNWSDPQFSNKGMFAFKTWSQK